MLQKLIAPDLAKLKVVEDTVDHPGGFIEGYASVFGNTDLGGDIVEKGAFKKTLKERMPTGAVKFVDSHKVYEGTAAVLGVVTDAKEDDYGLWFHSKVSMVQRAQDVRTKVKEGILNAISFGYDIIKAEAEPKTGSNRLKELKLYEISVVIWGMNPLAEATAAKGLLEPQTFKTAPIEHQWNSEEALSRAKAWVSPKPMEEWTDVECAKFYRLFLWMKSDTPMFQIVDIVDDEPQYVLGAIESALATIRSGVKDAPWSADADVMETRIKELYGKFTVEFPVKGHIIQPVSILLPALSETATALAASRLLKQMKDFAEAIRVR